MAKNKNDPNANYGSFSIYDVLEMLSKYRWRFIFVAYLGSMTILLLALLYPLKYKGTSSVQRTTDEITDSVLDQQLLDQALWVRTVRQEIRSEDTFDEVIYRIRTRIATNDLDLDISDDQARALFNSSVIATDTRGAITKVTISITGDEPQVIRVIVNTMAEVYAEQATKDVQEKLLTSKEETEAELNRIEDERLRLQSEIADLKSVYQMVLLESINETRSEQLQLDQDIATLSQSIELTQSEILRTQEDISSEKAQQEVIEDRIPNTARSELSKQIRESKIEKNKLKQQFRYSDEHPRMVVMQSEIDQLEAELIQMPEFLISTRVITKEDRNIMLVEQLRDLRYKVTNDQTRLGHMQTENNRLKALLNNGSSAQKRLHELNNNLASVELERRNLSESMTKLRTALRDTERNEVRVSGRASYAQVKKAIEPSFRDLIFATLVVGLGLGAVVVFLSNKLNDSIQSVDFAKTNLPLPVIGVIEDIKTESEIRWIGLRQLLLLPLVSLLMLITLLFMVGLNYGLISGHIKMEDINNRINQYWNSSTEAPQVLSYQDEEAK